jgi:hypothetical protein
LKPIGRLLFQFKQPDFAIVAGLLKQAVAADAFLTHDAEIQGSTSCVANNCPTRNLTSVLGAIKIGTLDQNSIVENAQVHLLTGD